MYHSGLDKSAAESPLLAAATGEERNQICLRHLEAHNCFSAISPLPAVDLLPSVLLTLRRPSLTRKHPIYDTKKLSWAYNNVKHLSGRSFFHLTFHSLCPHENLASWGVRKAADLSHSEGNQFLAWSGYFLCNRGFWHISLSLY